MDIAKVERVYTNYAGVYDHIFGKIFHESRESAVRNLRIAPNEATEDAFRRIFGGCAPIVESLGTIRNRMGNAHGRRADAVRVEPRYARLAVNLSGAMATFLIETWEATGD